MFFQFTIFSQGNIQMKADPVSQGSQTCCTAIVTPTMTSSHPADIVPPKAVLQQRLHRVIGNPPCSAHRPIQAAGCQSEPGTASPGPHLFSPRPIREGHP